MKRRDFIKRGALFLPSIFVPRLIRAQSVLTADGLAAFGASEPSGGGGGGGYSLINHTFASAGTSGGTTPDINTTGGNKVFICVGSFSAIPTPTDNKGNTYTQIVGSTSIGGYFVSMWGCLSATCGTGHHFVTNQANTFGNLCVMVFSGGTGVVDQTNVATASGASSQQPGSITPTTNNQLILCAYNGGRVTTMLIDSGFTISDQTNSSAGAEQTAFAYLIQSTAGAVNPTWSEVSPGGDDMAAAIASIK